MAAARRFSQLGTLLPSQHFALPGKQRPEQRLMIAVLGDALDCIEKYRLATDPEGLQIFHEARQWLLAAEADWLYSFQSICGALDLDSAAVLQRLRLETRLARPLEGIGVNEQQ